MYQLYKVNEHVNLTNLLVRVEALQMENLTVILTTMCATLKIRHQVLLLWAFLQASLLIFLAFLKPYYSRRPSLRKWVILQIYRSIDLFSIES